MNHSTIGIIVVNWVSVDETEKLISLVKHNTYTHWSLVVVNNSPCHKARLSSVEDSQIGVIHNSYNVGFAKAVNQGIDYLITHVQPGYFLIINNDIEVPDNFLEDLILQANNEQTVYSPVILRCGTDKIDNTGGRIIIPLGGTVNMNKNRQYSNIIRSSPDFLSGACLFFHKKVFRTIGAFDESFFAYYEDVDFSIRALEAGLRIKILWNISVSHKKSSSTRNNKCFKLYLIARSQILFARKHLVGIRRCVFMAAGILRGMLFNVQHVGCVWRGVWDGLFNKDPVDCDQQKTRRLAGS